MNSSQDNGGDDNDDQSQSNAGATVPIPTVTASASVEKPQKEQRFTPLTNASVKNKIMCSSCFTENRFCFFCAWDSRQIIPNDDRLNSDTFVDWDLDSPAQKFEWIKTQAMDLEQSIRKKIREQKLSLENIARLAFVAYTRKIRFYIKHINDNHAELEDNMEQFFEGKTSDNLQHEERVSHRKKRKRKNRHRSSTSTTTSANDADGNNSSCGSVYMTTSSLSSESSDSENGSVHSNSQNSDIPQKEDRPYLKRRKYISASKSNTAPATSQNAEHFSDDDDDHMSSSESDEIVSEGDEDEPVAVINGKEYNVHNTTTSKAIQKKMTDTQDEIHEAIHILNPDDLILDNPVKEMNKSLNQIYEKCKPIHAEKQPAWSVESILNHIKNHFMKQESPLLEQQYQISQLCDQVFIHMQREKKAADSDISNYCKLSKLLQDNIKAQASLQLLQDTHNKNVMMNSFSQTSQHYGHGSSSLPSSSTYNTMRAIEPASRQRQHNGNGYSQIQTKKFSPRSRDNSAHNYGQAKTKLPKIQEVN